MPKLVIQIPCFNEEDTLGITLAQLPKSLPGIDQVEWLIIDDGSIDATVRVAREGGVHHIIQRPHQGLSRAFLAGLEAAVEHGADIIVNLDADNQYDARDIPSLIRPILEGSADLVIGARPVSQIEHFSFWKKLLQRLGSWVVRTISRTDTPDAPSGFRALSREAAMRTHVFNQHTYTLETVIQAGLDGMAITSVPIRVNQELRPSRLVKSVPEYIRRQVLTIFRIFVTYKAFAFFLVSGSLIFLCGVLIGVRFLYFFFSGSGGGHVQSLLLATLLLATGFFLAVIGLLADLISVNRRLLERLDWRLQKIDELVRPTPENKS